MPFMEPLIFFDHLKLENTYELFFPRKEQGLVIIWLYERIKDGTFPKGVFKEKDIQKAFDEVSMISREKRERQPWEYYNSHIMALQEFFLLYDEEHQAYTLKDYASYICDKVFKMLSNRFNPTIIEITCTDLSDKLGTVANELDLLNWLTIYFDKARPFLKEQIDYLLQQIDNSVNELSEKAKLKSGSLLSALREIESQIDKIRQQNQELRGAFREIDKIKSILMTHPFRAKNSQIDENATEAIDYFDSIRIMLNMVDSRIDKIQPKIQQFFSSLNRQQFDTKVEKFLYFLLDGSYLASGELQLPVEKESFAICSSTQNFTIIERKGEMFPVIKNKRIEYVKDIQKEFDVHNLSRIKLSQQNYVTIWLERIKQETLLKTKIHLSMLFFQILEKHNGDLQLAVSIIYQAILIYDKHNNWGIVIDKERLVINEKCKFTIWDIWIIRNQQANTIS